jgi:hypothetical protein
MAPKPVFQKRSLSKRERFFDVQNPSHGIFNISNLRKIILSLLIVP